MTKRLSEQLADLSVRAKNAGRSNRLSWLFLTPSTAAWPPKKPSTHRSTIMKTTHLIVLAGFAIAAPAISHAQVAGSTFRGATYAELRDVAMGWSAKRQILGQPVYNDVNERVGSIDDIIVTSDKSVSYAIINAGGFLAVTKHDVAVPVSQLKLVDGKLVLAGATKDALKTSPPFEYAH